MRRCGVLLALVALPSLAGCARDPSAEALESLSASAASPRYHSGFWAAEAAKQSPLWTKAQTYCRVPDHEGRPNCRIVVAVDVTVRILAVRPDDDLNERVRHGSVAAPESSASPRPARCRRTTRKGFDRAAQDANAARERHVSSTILNDIVRDYEAITAAWFSALVPIAQAIFWILVADRARLVGDLVGIDREDGLDGRHRLLRKVVAVGFFYALLLNGSTWIPAVISGFSPGRLDGVGTHRPEPDRRL